MAMDWNALRQQMNDPQMQALMNKGRTPESGWFSPTPTPGGGTIPPSQPATSQDWLQMRTAKQSRPTTFQRQQTFGRQQGGDLWSRLLAQFPSLRQFFERPQGRQSWQKQPFQGGTPTPGQTPVPGQAPTQPFQTPGTQPAPGVAGPQPIFGGFRPDNSEPPPSPQQTYGGYRP